MTTALPEDRPKETSEQGSHRFQDQGEIHLYNKREIQLVRGEGVYLWDDMDRRYLDAMSNYGVNVLGHKHPAVDAAIRSQLDRLMSCHQSFYNDAREEFEKTFLAQLPPELQRAVLCQLGRRVDRGGIEVRSGCHGPAEDRCHPAWLPRTNHGSPFHYLG